MPKTNFKSVDDYLAAKPASAKTPLERVRSAIREALPAAEEVISYNIPAYKLPGGRAIYFAGWKQHYSLYPVNDELVAAFKNDLAAYEVEKGTIRFPLSEPVPAKLIARIARFRAKQTAERAKTKTVAPKKKR